MTSIGLISFIFGVGSAGWIYNKMQRKTGNNTSVALKVAALSGLAIWLVLFFVLGMISQ